MKKIIFCLLLATLAICTVSAKANKKKNSTSKIEPPPGFELFMDVEKPVPATALKEKVTSSSFNTLQKDTGTKVSLVIDKDWSKEEPEDLMGGNITVVEVYGQKCLKITPNYNPEIRFAYIFEKPITLKDINHMKFSLCGMDGVEGSYNIALLYEEMALNGEHVLSCYSKEISRNEWSTFNLDLKADEIWGSHFSNTKKIIGIQLWSGSKDPLFIKDVSLTK